MRRPRFPAPALLIISMIALSAIMPGSRPVTAQQVGTPAVATPAPAQPTAAPAAPDAQAATPVPQATTDVVTLTFWYANPVDRDIIELLPLQVGPDFVAGPQPGAAAVGTVDFPEDGSPPTVVVGDTTFETYPRPDGIVERWTWMDDIEGARPGTLVMQLAGQSGTYQDYFGAATFVSRDEGGVGGVLTIVLRPPSAAAAAQPATDAAAAEPAAEDAAAEPIAEEAAVEGEAPADAGGEVILEEPVEVIVEEPVIEDEQPVVEGEIPAEPTE